MVGFEVIPEAVLTRDSHRMRTFLGKAGVVHDPGHHWSLLLHRRQHMLAHLFQHYYIAPWRFRHQVM